MKHSISHNLGKQAAKKATLAAFDSYQQRFQQYQPRADWVNEDTANISFSVKGMTLKGSIEIREDAIVLDLHVPFVLKPFKGKALGTIENEITDWIAKARSGQI